MSFLLCQGCSRHVKSSDSACPFCGEATVSGKPAGDPRFAGARQRSRLLFGAAVAAVAGATAVSGCSSSSTTTNTKDSGVAEDSGMVAAYGGPLLDSGNNDQDTGTPVALYGAAQVDAGGD